MTVPGETEAGSAGMQPCRGIAWWAHRDDVAERGGSPFALSPKTYRIGRPLCLENPRPEGAECSLTENATSPFHAEPEHLPISAPKNQNSALTTATVCCSIDSCIVPLCKSEAQRFGTNRNGSQRFRCTECKKTFSAKPEDRIEGSTIPLAEIEKVLQLLIEGCSVRSAERISGLHRDTILKLLVAAGEQCEKLMGRVIVNVPVKDVECDELFAFVAKKQKLVKPDDDPSYGDAYTFVAIERNTKLVLNFALGKRNQGTTDIFIEGLRHATSGKQKFQITTDGFAPYRSAITTTLHDRISGFAQLIKVYGAPTEGEGRYSPAEVKSVEVVPVYGDPDPERICTSIVERHNLSTRMSVRRFTRLTIAFSKNWENHWAAVALWFGYYNFCWIHKSLRVSPAMEGGITDHI